jgi:hypothetical protein
VFQRNSATVLGAVVLSLFVTGCSSGGSVSGKVTLDGAPLQSGTVTFHPVNGGPSAVGTISADGKYELAIGNDRSVPPGDYVVTVVATETLSSAQAADPKKAPTAPKRLTPDKYASKDSTDLKVAVKGGGNDVPLELKSK